MINITILQGTLTADPQTDHDGDKTVTTFRLAVERPGPTPRTVDHFTVECWNGQARACGTYLREGRRVTVQGSLRHDEWKDRAGRRVRDYVLARHVDFDDNRREADSPHSDNRHSIDPPLAGELSPSGPGRIRR